MAADEMCERAREMRKRYREGKQELIERMVEYRKVESVEKALV